MRASTLQYLYLQKPISTVIILCLISVLPWIVLGDFSTKGESREATVAASILKSGEWFMPEVYAGEPSYNPPLNHWLVAIFSYPQGYVNEFTARLPSALAFTILIACVLLFFGKQIRFQEAFIASLLLITCFGLHRAAISARVDMLLTMFIFLALMKLFRWENKQELKGLPVSIPLMLSGAILTKGPVGVVLPLLVFGVYLLLLRKYSLFKIAKSLLYAGVSSLFLPALWYVSVWKQEGKPFLDNIWAENVGRFLSLDTDILPYNIGHSNGIGFNIMTLIYAFIPWTVLAFFTLFGMKIKMPGKTVKQFLQDLWTTIRSMEKSKLFSLVAIISVFVFYSIPLCKKSMYMMPAYPFIGLFLSQFFLYISEHRSKVTRVFASLFAILVTGCLVIFGLTMAGVMDPAAYLVPYIEEIEDQDALKNVFEMFRSPSALTIIIIIMLLIALGAVYYQLSKRINIKMLYATIALAFCANIMIDGVIMLGVRKGGSARTFAKEIQQKYPIDENNVFVINDPKKYENLYGLNFYMNNIFQNFETKKPESGYFLSLEEDLSKIQKVYENQYTFIVLETSSKLMQDVRQRVVLSSFSRKYIKEK